MTTPKVLIWDIETSLSIVTTFQLKTDYISHDSIIQDWNILSAAWKWLNKPKVYAMSVSHRKVTDDKKLVVALRKVILEADIIVGHNSDKFDHKKLNTRLLFHGLQPLPSIRSLLTVDTLKEARKHFSFTSNRLDYIAKYLGVGEKLPHGNGLWMKVLMGDKQALVDMVKYNKHDVYPLQEGVYKKLLPYIDHPNVGGIFNDGRPHCRNCGSEKMHIRGNSITRTGLRNKRFQCQDCGHYMQERKSTENNASLLLK